jgi:hypothetical protein
MHKFVLRDKQCKQLQYFPQLCSIYVHVDGPRDRKIQQLNVLKDSGKLHSDGLILM